MDARDPRPDPKAAYRAAIADYVLANGLGAASLRPLARAAGTSDRMLLYHFGTKAALVGEVLDHIAAQSKATLEAVAPGDTRTLDALFSELTTPGMRAVIGVWQEVVAGAARGDATLAAAGHRIAADMLEWLRDRLPDAQKPLAPLALAVMDGAAEMHAVGHEAAAHEAVAALFALLPPAR